MRAFVIAAMLAAIAAASCGKTLRSRYCRTDNDCKAMGIAGTCNNAPGVGTFMCVGDGGASDAPDGPDGGNAGDAPEGGATSDAGDASDATIDVPFSCTMSSQCVGREGGAGIVCDPNSGACVECLPMPTMMDACMGMTPICVGTTCAPCAKDTDCTGPGICMTDGHCASDGEVIYVEFRQAGCGSADGSLASPYCTPNGGVDALVANATKRVIVIRGPVNGPMVIASTTPLVLGRPNGLGEAGQIVTAVGTGITVSAGDVLIRGLEVVGGGSNSSKGIVASGSSTKVSLSGVKISLGMGLGIQADTGADVAMDRCYVQNNSTGGLLINGASYNIQNSVFAGNGYGIKFNATAIPRTSRAAFNTIVMNMGNAVTCDSTNPQTLTDSIIVGLNDSCTITNSILAMPTFKTTPPPYHLMSRLLCLQMPASATVPAYDIDGEPRVAPDIDCGADQFGP